MKKSLSLLLLVAFIFHATPGRADQKLTEAKKRVPDAVVSSDEKKVEDDKVDAINEIDEANQDVGDQKAEVPAEVTQTKRKAGEVSGSYQKGN